LREAGAHIEITLQIAANQGIITWQELRLKNPLSGFENILRNPQTKSIAGLLWVSTPFSQYCIASPTGSA